MYGKFYECAFTGSMIGAGASVYAVWAYVIAHTRRSAMIELNPILLAAVIGCEKVEVEHALDFLCAPDPLSRSRVEEGRRLVKEGPFFYRVVNKALYDSIRDEDSRREYQRKKQGEYRAEKKTRMTDNPDKNGGGIAQVEVSGGESGHLGACNANEKNSELKKTAIAILEFLNEKTGRRYRPVDANVRLVVCRLREEDSRLFSRPFLRRSRRYPVENSYSASQKYVQPFQEKQKACRNYNKDFFYSSTLYTIFPGYLQPRCPAHDPSARA